MADTNLKLSNFTLVMATKEQVSCELGEEAAILGMKNSVYYGLNPVGTRIWQLLKEPRTVAEICGAIANEYDVSRERAESDLLEFLQQMLSEGLVELSSDATRNCKEGEAR